MGCRPEGQTLDQIEYRNLTKTPDTKGIKEITEREKSFPRVNSQEDLLKGDLSAVKTPNPVRVTSRRDLPQANWEDQYESIEDLPMKHRFLNLIVQQLRFDKDLEAVKESLFCYEGFNLKDSFKVYDPRGTGTLTIESFMHL